MAARRRKGKMLGCESNCADCGWYLKGYVCESAWQEDRLVVLQCFSSDTVLILLVSKVSAGVSCHK